MHSCSERTNPSATCGGCNKMIRMRDGTDTVLCTVMLDVVETDKKGCKHYEESAEKPDR